MKQPCFSFISHRSRARRLVLQSRIALLIIPALILMLRITTSTAASQAPSIINLRVGVLNTPPYSYFVKDKPVGISYDIWQLITNKNKFNYQYIPVGEDIDAAVSKVSKGEIDILLGQVLLLSSREELGYYSLPFFRSEFVLLAKKTPMHLAARISHVFQSIPPYSIGIILFVYISYILIFYLCEHKKQPALVSLSRKHAFELILWQNLLAASGIGTPPFFPTTRFMRALSIIWKFLVTASFLIFFAKMTSEFLSAWQSSQNRLLHLSDLENKIVDAEGGAMSLYTAQKVGLNVGALHKNVDDGVKQLENPDIAAIFMPKVVALTYLKTHNRNDLYISSIKLPSYSVGYLFNDKSERFLRETNYNILKITETGEKLLICKKYLGLAGEDLCY